MLSFPSKYSINLMWINSKLNPEKPYITPHETEGLFLEEVLKKISKWKQGNPQAEVNFWYDSHFTTIDAINRTKALLEKKSNTDLSFQFNLKDIRSIGFVRQNPDAFSDYVPIYYRVDLLKLILCVNSIETDAMDAALFADLEVGDQRKDKGRMSKEELFTSEIMTRLECIGLQVNEDGIKDENQFFQILNKSNTLNAIKTYINACLARAMTALNNSEEHPHLLLDLGGAVYSMMSTQLFALIEMVAYEQEILVKANLFESNPTEEWIKYDLIKHGHLPLGNLFLSIYNSCYHLPSGAEITVENLVPYHKLIKFSEMTNQHPFSRKNMQTRQGRSHKEWRENLTLRKPTEGETYKFHTWPLKEIKMIKSPLIDKLKVLESPTDKSNNGSLPNEQQRLIDRFLNSINPILIQLEKKIKAIAPKHQKTIQKTSFLLTQLKDYRENSLLQLQSPNASLSKIGEDFIKKSEKAFSTTKKELKDDLNWIEYLTHFFKKLVRAITSIFSKNHVNFFSPTKIDYINEIESIEKEIKQSSIR